MRVGLLMDDSYGLKVNTVIKSGMITQGLQVGDTDSQNINNLCISEKGWWRENPTLGVSPRKYVKSTNKQFALKRAIDLTLVADGYTNIKTTVSSTGVVTMTDK